jgi:uncharacterized membrane protein YbhN (UPF0104 family)
MRSLASLPVLRRLAVAGIAALAGVTLMVAVPSLQSVLDELNEADPGWIAIAAALEVASCLSFVVAFRLSFDRVAAPDARRLAWVSMAGSVLLPGGGVSGLACSGWLMHRAGEPARWIAQRSSALFFLTGACNVAAIAAAAFLLLESPTGPHDFARVGLPLIGAAAAVAAVVTLSAIGGRVRQRRWAGDLIAGIRDAQHTLTRPHWRLLGAVGWLVFDIAVLWATFSALGTPPAPAALALGYLVGYLANVIPVPGGVGVLDGGLTAALILYGAPAADAAAAVLLYHAVAFWIPSLGGLAAYAALQRGAAVAAPAIA